MTLSKKTLEVLREIINEKSQTRSGRMLVDFFNALGFHDSYGPGFPSRWIYTDEKLNQLNSTATLDQCIRNVFAPVNYIENPALLDELLELFNNHLQYDEWTLENYIAVAYELGYIKEDVKRFSHTVQNFRNYIHPYQQISQNFTPTIDTALLCAQVVKMAINQIGNKS